MSSGVVSNVLQNGDNSLPIVSTYLHSVQSRPKHVGRSSRPLENTPPNLHLYSCGPAHAAIPILT